ncbi:hypothetical protein BDY21DRAFT_278496 [Lineolata rhizophorae]|uniref:Cupredoxin n=1 Tax=Lineolata rhizophorae TaxID=578093 RepID=A0A6A6PD94_9PEZI|nr:hypothetical protein BDY21DRAFT_278496 [Lineolata rhizophorae]
MVHPSPTMMEYEYPSPAVAAAGMTHTVIVGGVQPAMDGGDPTPMLMYNPESITASIGDVVHFVFMQANHTVTQSTFDQPCKAMEGGMDSGFMPNPDGAEGVTWDMPVESEDPLWFYCKQRMGVHCGKGMVFSINAATAGDKTFQDFKQLAIQINGTEAVPLESAAIQQPGATAVESAVTVIAHASSTVAPAMVHETSAVAMGQGFAADGSACNCHCLCDAASGAIPAVAGVGSFGGVVGESFQNVPAL